MSMSSREIHEVKVDRSILAWVYQSCGGPSWSRSTNWLTGVPLSQWWGVTVGDRGRVIGLDLRRNGLTGFLPDVLGNLRRLEELDLSANRLNEPKVGFADVFKWTPAQIRRVAGREGIPAQLGHLTSLRLLNLSGNMFHFPIPGTLGNLSNLEVLDLHDNYLNGMVPVELGNLANLREVGPIGQQVGC